MKRLSGLDASFLYLETSTQLLHVCGLLVLQPDSVPDGYSFTSRVNQVADAAHVVVTAGTGVPTSGLVLGRDH